MPETDGHQLPGSEGLRPKLGGQWFSVVCGSCGCSPPPAVLFVLTNFVNLFCLLRERYPVTGDHLHIIPVVPQRKSHLEDLECTHYSVTRTHSTVIPVLYYSTVVVEYSTVHPRY